MAKYSESDKKAYAAYRKGGGSLPFGAWLRTKTVGTAYGKQAQRLYKQSATSKKNRGVAISSKKERP